MARPTIYTKELTEKICDRIARGDSLRRICSDDNMPVRKTVHLWLLDTEKKEFLHQYETACNIRAENMFDEIEDIADNDGEVQRDRLRVDTRKWYLSKVLPKKFGDKMDLTTDGKPFTVQISKEVADKNDLNPSTESDSN
jgi:replication initiation and membrane attachment protein DnaB